MKSLEIDSSKESLVYEQIDITEDYLEVCKSVLDNTRAEVTPKIKDKVYPEGVKKITYSPQTESLYYYESDNIKTRLTKKSWELFEDRGAIIETELIEHLKAIDEIKQDYEMISKEEKHIDEMLNGEIAETIIGFVHDNGSKAFRHRIDLGTKERCLIFQFERANMKEEIVLFDEDKYLILNREDQEGNIHQRVMKYMNRTVISWYLEGLLRLKRLDDKQKQFLSKAERKA